MVTILKKGLSKHFVQRCPHCATDFIYQRNDVTARKIYGTQIFYNIECPECHATLRATFEEYEEGIKEEE